MQQIQSQIETLQSEMRTQRSNIVNAKNAAARSNDGWTKELGITDEDLSNILRIRVKDRLQRYKKGLAKLEAQLNDLEKGPNEATKSTNEQEQYRKKSAIVSYDDSFVDIINAAKAVAHLV